MKRATNLLLVSTILCFSCALTVSAQSFGGRSVGVNASITVNGSTSNFLTADTGQLPTTGGNLAATAVSSSIPNILSTGPVSSNVSGFLRTTIASSTVNNVDIFLPGLRIRANSVLVNAACICCPGADDPTCSANIRISGLTFTDAAGVVTSVAVTGQANQVINLPNGLGTLTVNEQATMLGAITVNGLHVNAVQGSTKYDIIVASATALIQCFTVSPVPAEVRVSGRVLSLNGKPLGRGSVTLTDAAGNVRDTTTSSTGEFIFDKVEVGHTYIIQVAVRGYDFAPVTINLLDETVLEIRPVQ